MFNIGLFEMTLFGIIALIVLGPEKLIVAARTLGRWYGTLRRASTRLQSEIASELQLLEAQEELKKELAKIRESEAQMKAQMNALQQSLGRTESQFHTATSQAIDAWQTIPEQLNDAISDTNPTTAQTLQSTTQPMANRWFVLGDYDRARRLPAAPMMPNYTADPLLNRVNS